MAKGATALFVALALDGLQALISLGLAGVIVSTSIIPIVGAAAAPLGVVLGIIINACISLTMGSALVFVVLPLCGLWYPSKMLPAFLEVVPGINNLPVWTIGVVQCILHKYKEEKGMSLFSTMSNKIRSKNPDDARMPRLAKAVFAARILNMPEQEVPQKQPIDSAQRSAVTLRNFDGIRKAGAVAVLLFCISGTAHAQALPDPVQYIVSPEVPGPNQQVTIEAQGIGAFLGDATITWQKDGQAVQSGAGLRTYTLMTGGLGSITRVRIDIKSTTNGSFSREFVFRPSVVNLVWEADTSAPPLYLGKPLYSAGSPLKIAAFPTIVINGSRVAPQSLSYQWSRNDEPQPQQSGLGRSTLAIDGDQLQAQEDIGLDVYFGSSLVARGGIVIPATEPQLALYERDALRGILYDAVLPQAFALNAKEITIAAQPYHFALPTLAAGAIPYTWDLNGDEITGPDSARGVLTLRQTGTGEGTATLGVALQNNTSGQLVQAARTAVSILFGQQGSATASFLGL